MESKYLALIACVALVCLTGITIVAVYLGHDGTLLMTVAGVFGIIIGAIAKTISEKRVTK